MGAASTAHSDNSSSGLALRQLVIQYFSDLNSHRYRAAWLLESPCNVTFKVPNPAGEPAGSGDLPGRNAALSSRSSQPFLRAAHIISVHRFTTPLLATAQFVGFHVNGRFTFVYPRRSAGFPGNNEHRSGYHSVVIVVRRCDGQWRIDPNWMNAGEPYNWT